MRSATSHKRLLELMDAERRRRGLQSVAEEDEDDDHGIEAAGAASDGPPSLRRARSGTLRAQDAEHFARALVHGRSWASGGSAAGPVVRAAAGARLQIRAGRRGSLTQAVGRHARRRRGSTVTVRDWPAAPG